MNQDIVVSPQLPFDFNTLRQFQESPFQFSLVLTRDYFGRMTLAANREATEKNFDDVARFLHSDTFLSAFRNLPSPHQQIIFNTIEQLKEKISKISSSSEDTITPILTRILPSIKQVDLSDPEEALAYFENATSCNEETFKIYLGTLLSPHPHFQALREKFLGLFSHVFSLAAASMGADVALGHIANYRATFFLEDKIVFIKEIVFKLNHSLNFYFSHFPENYDTIFLIVGTLMQDGALSDQQKNFLVQECIQFAKLTFPIQWPLFDNLQTTFSFLANWQKIDIWRRLVTCHLNAENFQQTLYDIWQNVIKPEFYTAQVWALLSNTPKLSLKIQDVCTAIPNCFPDEIALASEIEKMNAPEKNADCASLLMAKELLPEKNRFSLSQPIILLLLGQLTPQTATKLIFCTIKTTFLGIPLNCRERFISYFESILPHATFFSALLRAMYYWEPSRNINFYYFHNITSFFFWIPENIVQNIILPSLPAQPPQTLPETEIFLAQTLEKCFPYLPELVLNDTGLLGQTDPLLFGTSVKDFIYNSIAIIAKRALTLPTPPAMPPAEKEKFFLTFCRFISERWKKPIPPLFDNYKKICSILKIGERQIFEETLLRWAAGENSQFYNEQKIYTIVRDAIFRKRLENMKLGLFENLEEASFFRFFPNISEAHFELSQVNVLDKCQNMPHFGAFQKFSHLCSEAEKAEYFSICALFFRNSDLQGATLACQKLLVKIYLQLGPTKQQYVQNAFPETVLFRKVLSKISNTHTRVKWQTLYANFSLLQKQLTMREQEECVSLLATSPYDRAEVAIFKFLKRVIEENFKIKEKQFLPVVEKLFPHSVEMREYFQQVDQLQHFYLCISKKITDPEQQKFIHVVFNKLFQEGFDLVTIQKITHVLGRFLFAIDNYSPDKISEFLKQSIDDIDSTPNHFESVKITRGRFTTTDLKYGKFEQDIILHLVSYLVRPDGSLNRWLIDDLKSWIKEQTEKVSPHLQRDLLRVLNELRNNERISEILSQSPIPHANSVGHKMIQSIVHTQNISQKDATQAILSACLTTGRQLFNYGSCQTAGPLIALKNTSLELQLRDFQEILLKGYLSREIEGQEVHYQATVAVYPALKARQVTIPKIDDEKREAQARQALCEELSCDPLLDTAWGSLRPHSEKTLLVFLQETIVPSKKDSISFDEILDSMKPQDMEQNIFEAYKFQRNCTYQNPLHQSWQNGVMGMHCMPLKFASTPTNKFRDALRESLQPFCEKFKNPDVFFYEHCPELQTLHFSMHPPRDLTSFDPLMSLTKEDKQHNFHPITNEQEFLKVIATIYFQITKERLTAEQQVYFIENMKRQMALETPWSYEFGIGGNSPLFSTYFKTAENFQRIEEADRVEQFRQWVFSHEGMKGLKVPMVWPGHTCTALANQRIIEGPRDFTDWQADLVNDFYALPCDKLHYLISGLVQKMLIEQDRYTLELQVSIEKCLSPKSNEDFLSWYRRFYEHFATEGVAPAIEDDYMTYTLKELLNTFPELERKLLYKFADTNWVGETSGLLSKVYYAFALMPTFSGVPEWRTVKICGDSIELIDFGSFDILQSPGPLFESFPAQSLLLASGDMTAAFKRQYKSFLKAWDGLKNTLSEEEEYTRIQNELMGEVLQFQNAPQKENLERQKEVQTKFKEYRNEIEEKLQKLEKEKIAYLQKLLQVHNDFRATIERFRTRNLEETQRLFTALHHPLCDPLVAEALYAETEQAFAKCIQDRFNIVIS
jgi:hypothetical protein